MSTTNNRYQKHGGANGGGRKKGNWNHRGPAKDRLDTEMTQEEVDKWFEDAKKMPLNTFFSEPAEPVASPTPKGELQVPPGMAGSRHNPANNGQTTPVRGLGASRHNPDNNNLAASNTPEPKVEAVSPKAERPITEAPKPVVKTDIPSPKNGQTNGIKTPVVQKNETKAPINKHCIETKARAILLAEQSLAAAEAAKDAAQKMLQASEDAVIAAKAQLLLARTQAQPDLQEEEEEEEL